MIGMIVEYRSALNNHSKSLFFRLVLVFTFGLLVASCASNRSQPQPNVSAVPKVSQIAEQVKSHLMQLINEQPEANQRKLIIATLKIGTYVKSGLEWNRTLNESRSVDSNILLDKLRFDSLSPLLNLDAIDILFLGDNPNLIRDYQKGQIIVESLKDPEEWHCIDISQKAKTWDHPGFCAYSLDCQNMEDVYFRFYYSSGFKYAELFCDETADECSLKRSWKSLFDIQKRPFTQRIYVSSADTYPNK